jgi:uncharacterized membrane protein YraQ (UPF0718 family)
MRGDHAMPKPIRTDQRGRLVTAAKQTLSMTAALVPIVLGVVLLTALLVEFVPADAMAQWFGRNAFFDAFTGAVSGSLAAGHPLTSYILGGELLERGVSLVAVTAFLVSWVTVGSIQLPAEMLMLGKRFALYRNLICFGLAILIALLTAATLYLVDLGP